MPSHPNWFRVSSLKSAEEEITTLKMKFQNAVVLLGKDATGGKFLSEISRHSLIHFCGHGGLGRFLLLSGPFGEFPPPFEPDEFSDLRKAERREGTKTVNMMEEWHPVTDLDLFDVQLREDIHYHSLVIYDHDRIARIAGES